MKASFERNKPPARPRTTVRGRAAARGRNPVIVEPSRADQFALLRHPLGLVATGLGTGLAPSMPGTLGSALAVLLWVGFMELQPTRINQVLVVVLAILICTWAADWASRRLGGYDPGYVVSDEWAGQWLVLLMAPPTWIGWLAAFTLFRAFDIAKPWPLRRLEELPDGLGVVADDLGAAVYAGLLLLAAQWLLPF